MTVTPSPGLFLFRLLERRPAGQHPGRASRPRRARGNVLHRRRRRRVAALVKANSGRPILAIDGCPMHCARACLAQHGVMPDVHITLSSYGLRKRYREDCSEEEIAALFEDMKQIIASDRMQMRAV